MYSWDHYQQCQFLTCAPAQLRHEELVAILEKLRDLRPDAMELTEVGKSYEGRAIYSVKIGKGPARVFAWSQMHGDEPTHTVSILDLLDLLQGQPDSPTAQAILEGCTLTLVPMLNPDGAERYTRRNAQDIDVNRDALHLASPEGRLLRQLVETVKPQFAFNLHNQQARTSVDGKHVAAVSLLVPPIDYPDTQTEWTRQARQVAVAFRRAIESKCAGMISRYDADFMPRCFGEWVQQQKIATITLEVGGWPEIDATPLTRVHSVGFISSILSIAEGSYSKLNPADYDALPRSSDQYLFDVIVRDVEVVPNSGEPFLADLGINYTRVVDRLPQKGGGRIDDLGDMCITTGKQELDGKGLKCVPGKIAYHPEFTPQQLPTTRQATEFLKNGITTVIGKSDHYTPVDRKANKPPINVGFADNGNEVAKLERGSIKLGAPADLVFSRGDAIEMVMLGGQVVLQQGELVVIDGGDLLREKGSSAR
jgi:predicted deacylase